MVSTPVRVRQRRPVAVPPSVMSSTALAWSQRWRLGWLVRVLLWRRGEFGSGGPRGGGGVGGGGLGEGAAEFPPTGGVASLDFGKALEVQGSLVERDQFGFWEWPAAFVDA